MRAKICNRLFSYHKPSVTLPIITLTAEDRAAMRINSNPIGTTIKEAANQIKQEIKDQGLDAVTLQLEKEILYEAELSKTLKAMEQQSITTVAASFNEPHKEVKEIVKTAIKRLVEEGLDYQTNKEIIVTQNSLATRLLAVKSNPGLLNLSYNDNSIPNKF